MKFVDKPHELRVLLQCVLCSNIVLPYSLVSIVPKVILVFVFVQTNGHTVIGNG